MRQAVRIIVPDERGFTLLEILVALFILGTALALTMQLFSADLRGVAASDHSMRAVLLAEERLQELMAREELPTGNWIEAERDGWRVEVEVSDELSEKTDGLGVTLRKITLSVRRATDRHNGIHEKAYTFTTLRTQVRTPGT